MKTTALHKVTPVNKTQDSVVLKPSICPLVEISNWPPPGGQEETEERQAIPDWPVIVLLSGLNHEAYILGGHRTTIDLEPIHQNYKSLLRVL